MTDYPEDVYTEPSDVDVHTLRNLGPLPGLAGVWEGTRSLDVNPKAEGPEEPQVFVERIELQPIRLMGRSSSTGCVTARTS